MNKSDKIIFTRQFPGVKLGNRYTSGNAGLQPPGAFGGREKDC